MVSIAPVSLAAIHEALRSTARVSDDCPCHVAAFCAWVTGNKADLQAQVRRALDFDGQARHPEHIAALGFGAAGKVLDEDQSSLMNEEIKHLSGRNFFSPGRPLRIEADGVGLLGIALGADEGLTGGAWLVSLLKQASANTDPWQHGLMRAARVISGEADISVSPPELSVALAEVLGWNISDTDVQAAWQASAQMFPHMDGVARDAVRLAVFEFALARIAHVSVGAAGVEDLKALLLNSGRALKLWRFEEKPRTANSAIARWDVENEYHVQSFLWAILAPVFPDLEDEENLPSVGHKHPRADLGIPSLHTIVEVKFLRSAGQAALAKVTEEVAADASLYLSTASGYDNIMVVVWDDSAQTEQHHELKAGLESIRGITCAVILPRPLKMKR
ncbi:hypothetical protein DSM25559_0378 [Agrobacterium rosae]|uniref:Uncharacterized protein n=1 Tax=Agrobacterium rosae TaxID=1972867 RepID=A0A1R3TEZ0_9HYPH|nr:hypothetical protein DSM25559_0378 [Agrobacterium rosae]